MTIAFLDGFEAQITSLAAFNAGGVKPWDALTNPLVADTAIFNPLGGGSTSLKMTPSSGVAARFGRNIPAGNRVFHVSFYLRVGAYPAASYTLASIAGPTNPPSLVLSAAGLLQTRNSSGGTFGSVGTLNLNTWYLIDWIGDVSTSTFTSTASIDGGPVAQGSRTASTPADFTSVLFGSSTAPSVSFDLWWDDIVYGFSTADFPYGPHGVRLLVPVADGTHNAGTNVVEDQAGANIGSVTAYDLINEVPPENTDYIKQIAAGSGNYAEVQFATPATANIMGALAKAVLEGAATLTSDLLFRIVDGSGVTLLDQGGALAVSSTTRRASVGLIPPPGGASLWTPTTLAAIRGRVGFATDVSPVPRAIFLGVEYAVQCGREPTGSLMGLPI